MDDYYYVDIFYEYESKPGGSYIRLFFFDRYTLTTNGYYNTSDDPLPKSIKTIEDLKEKMHLLDKRIILKASFWSNGQIIKVRILHCELERYLEFASKGMPIYDKWRLLYNKG